MPDKARSRALPRPERDDLMTPDDIRRELGIGRDATYRLIKSGLLPRIPHIRRPLVRRQSFEAFLRGDAEEPATDGNSR